MVAYQNYETEVFADLKQMLHTRAKQFGNRTLFLQKRGNSFEHIGFQRFCTDVASLATELLAQGLCGKHIIIVGNNCYEWVTAFMAVTCGVGVAVPTEKELCGTALKKRIQKGDVSAVIGSPSVIEKLRAEQTKIKLFSFDEIPALISAGKQQIKTGNRSYLNAKPDPNALAALIFTSGSMEEERGVMLSHRNLCFNLSEMCKMIYIDEKDTFLSVLPLHHIYELTCGLLCPLYRGCTVAFGDGVSSMLKDMQAVHPTVVLCIPVLIETVYRRIQNSVQQNGMEKRVQAAINTTNSIPKEQVRQTVKREVFTQIHNSLGGKLRLLISGGVGADPSVLKGLRDFGITCVQGYGLTECSPIVTLNRDTFFNDRSAGMALPNTLLDICNEDGDGIGEIRISGEHVMMGYYNMPERTVEVIRNGWFYTGDLGYLDENGFLFITGRKKNIIVTKDGKFIFPEESEKLLLRHPIVKEVAVVGYPASNDANRQGADAVVAIIHPNYRHIARTIGTRITSAQLDLELKKVLADVNNLLPPHKRIQSYLLASAELPKTASHKIKREDLAKLYLSAYLDQQNKQ